MKDYTLYYWDRRLDEAEVKDLLNQAWEELYELEFDQVFGTWRGVHWDPETNIVHITWENMYGGPVMLISINRDTRVLRMDYAPDELIEKEEVEIERLRQLPPRERRKHGSGGRGKD